MFFLLVVLFVCLEISPDSFSLGLTKSIGSMVSVQAGQGGGWSGVEDVHPLSPLETKVSIQVHSPGCDVLDDEDEDEDDNDDDDDDLKRNRMMMHQ